MRETGSGLREGICKLTKKHGQFVKSHVIPRAFTKPEWKGAAWIQKGQSSPPVRRWDSWYDKHLVVDEGEKILARYDDWAVTELTKYKMVWSSWGPDVKLLSSYHTTFPHAPEWGVRRLRHVDQRKLRLFFLSLLWRASASDLPEFSEVSLPPSDMEQLCKMVLEGQPQPFNFYPVALVQLSTLGDLHNLTPIAQDKLIPAISANNSIDFQSEPAAVPIFRFYFDGLIAHIHRSPNVDQETMGRAMLGYDLKEWWINTVTYENSFERQNLDILRRGYLTTK